LKVSRPATGMERRALAGNGNLARHPQSIVGARATPDSMAGKIFDAVASHVAARYCKAAATAELKKKKATVGADDRRWLYYATLLEALS